MRSIANTRQRKKINLIVAVKAEKRIEDQKAEIKATSIKAMIEEAAPGVKKEMLIRRKRSRTRITVKIEIRLRKLIKTRQKLKKGAMVRELGPSR